MSIEDRPDGALVTVRVTPRSSRNQIEGVVDGILRVRITAAPVDGAANEALVRLLAVEFKLPKSSIEIVSGERSRTKTVLLHGRSCAEVLQMVGKA